MRTFITAILLTLPFSCVADEMQNLLDKLYELSNESVCTVNEDCSSLTLGWADCSISNYEFPISTKDKKLLSEILYTAKKYEDLWRNAVLANEIPKDCKVQKASNSVCESGKCILVGPQVPPTKPPIIDPNLTERLLEQ